MKHPEATIFASTFALALAASMGTAPAAKLRDHPQRAIDLNC